MAKRRRKSAFAKLRAKANKSIARKIRNTQKTVRRATRQIERTLASNSLARAGRKLARKTTRISKRLTKKAVKRTKKTLKAARQARKTTTKSLQAWRRGNRQRIRERKRAQSAANRALRIEQRQYNRLTLQGDVETTGATLRQSSDNRGSSRPGEPPRMRTGKGRQSITAELRMKGKKPEARTFVDKKVASYMAIWEFRPDNKQRPFLKPAVNDNITLLGREIGDSLRQTLRPQAGKKKAKVT